jgi:hypothetical protein
MPLKLANGKAGNGSKSALFVAGEAAGENGSGDLQSRPYSFYVLQLKDAATADKLSEKSEGSRQVNFRHGGSETRTWKEAESISEIPRDGSVEQKPGSKLFSDSKELQKALQRLAVVESQDPVRRRTYEVRQLDVMGLELTAWWLREDRAEPRDLFIPLKEALPPLVYGGVYEQEPFLQILREKAKELTGNSSRRKRISP